MQEYSSKTFVTESTERYVYQTKSERSTITYTNLASFPSSIVSLAYLDLEPVASLIQTIIDTLQRLAQTQNEKYEEEIYDLLDKLPEHHIYFLQLRADWKDRVYHAVQLNHYEEDLLQIEYLRELPGTLKRMQEQILDFFANVLDMDDGNEKAVSEKLIAYYKSCSETAFRFCPQLMNFELITTKDAEYFAEVLKPTSIYDMIDYHLRECVKREVKMRKCKNCGRYFAVTGRATTEYCNRPFDSRGRTCKEVGAIAQWTLSKKGDDVFNEYRREYKKRFARMKAGKLPPEEFYAWSKEAREVKAACEAGEITQDKFKAWLELT